MFTRKNNRMSKGRDAAAKKCFLFWAFLMVFSYSLGSEEIADITPQQAFELVKNPATYLVDVRSIAEYVFVGHPEMAYNIPLTFWNEEKQRFVINVRFLEEMLFSIHSL